MAGGLRITEVERIVLVAVGGHALAGLQLVERLARQAAIARKLAHRKIDVTIGRAVGQPLGLEAADHVEHGLHVVGGARLVRGRQHADGA